MDTDKKVTTINLGGEDRVMVLDLNAMVDFEKATGKTLWSIGEDITATDLRALLWACLNNDPDKLVGIGEVGKWVDMGNMGMLSDKVKDLISSVMPPSKDEKKQIKKVD